MIEKQNVQNKAFRKNKLILISPFAFVSSIGVSCINAITFRYQDFLLPQLTKNGVEKNIVATKSK
jgi:hypothetical protein